MFPFHWAGGEVQPDGSVVGGLGIQNAPRCKAAYEAQGQLIKVSSDTSAATQAKSPDRTREAFNQRTQTQNEKTRCATTLPRARFFFPP
jgi:hypothetical protein